MSWRRSAAVARHDLRVLRRDPAPLIILIFMPLVLMAFLKPAFRSFLVEAGAADANGAEQAVPGMTVMFAFFLVGQVGFAFFREHGWATWERLRASPATPAEIMVGKTVAPTVMAAVQISFLLLAGVVLFDLRIAGSVLALVPISLALIACLVALGFALVALCRTVMQLNAFANLGALLFAGFGGALAPIDTLPGWARAVAPATPGFWAMDGLQRVVADSAGVADVARPALVLVAFAVGLGALAAWRFRADETKTSWA